MVCKQSRHREGRHVEGTSGRFSAVYGPCTGEIQAQVPQTGAGLVMSEGSS